jgi:putative transposase
MKGDRPSIGVGRLCRLLGVTRQSFYQYEWRSQDINVQAELILGQVSSIRHLHPAIGTRKLYLLLQPFLLDHQIKIGRDGLFDLLNGYGLLVRKKKMRVATTQSHHRFYKYPDLTGNIKLSGVNQLWVSDITAQKLMGGQWVYISFVTDAYSHKILGYQVAENLDAIHCVTALKMALSGLDEQPKKLIHHSDRGIQYCSDIYISLLRDNCVSISMTQNGDPRENAIAERINGIIKEEYLYRYNFTTKKEVTQKLQEAVDLYNYQRPHMSCSMLTPGHVHQYDVPVDKKWKNRYPKSQAKDR